MTEAMKLTHQTSVGISSFQQCSHKGGSLNSVLLYIMVYVRNRGKGTGKQGTGRHVTGSETACLSI